MTLLSAPAVPSKAKTAIATLLSDTITPLSLFQKLSQDEPTAFLLESSEGDNRLARYSFIGVDPLKTISFKNGQCTIVDRLNNQQHSLHFNNPLEILQQLLQEQAELISEPLAGIPFQGGLVGYLGYGATQYLESIPAQLQDPLNVPDGFYGLYDSAIVFDHQFRRVNVISHRGADHLQKLLDTINSVDTSTPALQARFDLDDDDGFSHVASAMPKEKFLELVEQCKNHITAGEVFQIVLSQRFSLPVQSEPLSVYRVLQAINPSPYAYFLKCPDFSYIGSSPETFVQCQNRQVMLRALAGTRPRGSTELEDQMLAAELQASEKELAEHHMLVDLGRNDIGKVCRPGSIEVGQIATLTKFTHVMHLATEIRGQLQDRKSCFDAFAACFPRGTVSGAPKIRAMQLLSKLETEQRGIYAGVVGYFDFQGNSDGAIAIRSAVIKNGKAHVNAGAGIVFDSQAEAEYEETRNKARSIIKAIKLSERISTCR